MILISRVAAMDYPALYVRLFPILAVSWLLCLLAPATAFADVQDWEVNEIVTSGGGDVQARYVELRNLVGGCMFPTSRIEVYDANGAGIGSAAPFAVTTCFGPDTYFLFATSAAQAQFATDADFAVVPSLPVGSGQVCFVSSLTRYDCVRWGSIVTPVEDFFGAGDFTTATPPPDDFALSRISATHVISIDWDVLEPTPRGPNDGTPWTPPDAGPSPDAGPDAGPTLDAGPRPDARLLIDSAPLPDSTNTRFLDLDAGGGATCSTGSEPGGAALVLLALLALARRRTQIR
jgi:MYXO-CTERM domain-containing protein